MRISDWSSDVCSSDLFRGFANYYAIADGVKGSLDNLELIVIRSMLATVACRRRVGRASVQKSLLLGSDYGVSTMVRGQPRVHKLWRLKHLVVKAWDNPIVDKITVGPSLAQSPNDLATRLSAGACEACGDNGGSLETHKIGGGHV